MNFLNELKDRFFSDKPKFWNKVQIVGGAIGVVGGLIAYLPISLPAGIVAWGAYLLTSGTSIATLAQFAIKDKSAPEIKATIKEGLTDTKESLDTSIKKL